MEKLIPLISDIQEIIRKSDINIQISLPIIAVVGSQSTGISPSMQAKVHFCRALLEKNSSLKEKVQSLEDPSKFSYVKYKAINNTQSLQIERENILKICSNFANKYNPLLINYVVKIKVLAMFLYVLDSIPKEFWICYQLICLVL